MRPVCVVALVGGPVFVSGCTLLDSSIRTTRNEVLELERACESEDDLAACVTALEKSSTVKRSPRDVSGRQSQHAAEDRWLAKPRSIAAPGCEAGFAEACAHISYAMARLASRRTERGPFERESLDWARKACSLGHAELCIHAAPSTRSPVTPRRPRRQCSMSLHSALQPPLFWSIWNGDSVWLPLASQL